MKQVSTLLLILLVPVGLLAQQQTNLDIALRYLESQSKEWGLTPADLSDLAVNNEYQTVTNGVTHLYLIQRHQGIEVYNALANLNIQNGKVIFAGNRLVPNLANKVNATKPAISAQVALEKALISLGTSPGQTFIVKERISDQEMTFSKGSFSHEDIPVKLRYQQMPNGQVRLAWDMAIDPVNGQDYWSLRIDALNGDVLDQHSWTVHCAFGQAAEEGCDHHHAVEHAQLTSVQDALMQSRTSGSAPNSYHVFEYPIESPAHGDRSIAVDPADPVASPFGWHDTNGQPGAEYNYTRGNNVRAFDARNSNTTSQGNEPNGGSDLIFDFPLDENSEPENFTQAATVNLFYAINMLHDRIFHFGFTEEAGNFQATNYSNQGAGGDFVNGLAQFGAVGLQNINNADFSTPPDGGNGRMRMFLWDRSQAGAVEYLNITAPSEVAGKVQTSLASFGPQITASNPISGEIVIVDDGTNNPSQGCFNPTNDLNGKIALIDRGNCEFGKKILNAEKVGAIAVIICNFEDAFVNMGAGAVGSQVTIPSVFVRQSDCAQFRVFAGTGLTATIAAPSDPTDPDYLDGTLDNGIIAHEFAHGISNRLTGGPSQAGCLGSQEQMGEGWSDFFTLIMTAKPGDTPEKKRGIGTYVTREDNNGKGIRNFPYSTDMVINPVTYNDIKTLSVPHGVGSVWCSMLWDLYWAMADKYGYDANLDNPDAGNNRAIQLVMDGMKFQACSPGFIDGRDAILAADMANNNGENQCLIWEVFARRGLGVNADQGSSDDRSDGTENFEVPDCRPEMKVRKLVTPVINAGDNIDVVLTVKNDRPTPVSGVVVKDLIPENATFIAGSASMMATQNGDELLFTIGNMAAGASLEITYSLATSNVHGSELLYYEPCEVDDIDIWLKEYVDGANELYFEVSDYKVNSGNNAWGILNSDTTIRTNLYLIDPVTLDADKPILRFSHSYNTEYRADAGFVQISTDYGTSWLDIRDKLFREPYNLAGIQYSTFSVPNTVGFTGNSNGFIDTYIDLSEFAGQDVVVRWLFACDGNTADVTDGWFIDDVTFMGMYNYNTEACVSFDEGPDFCDLPSGYGTFVEHSTTGIDKEPVLDGIQVFPNPAREDLYVTIDRGTPADYQITLTSLEGKALWTQSLSGTTYQTVHIPLQSTTTGLYLIKIQSAEGVYVEKVVIKP
ncbi:MAG: T9SS-dependent M36 family metallopeptidase [Lewinellaceae bacterium]|nr:T9SS-dependent M36 family metallopeptidase [Saprospiraceae bacterium]MCB9312005.1 T9SS-dependent M36 family metallopeptidase [Lewinellaceae bacterium]